MALGMLLTTACDSNPISGLDDQSLHRQSSHGRGANRIVVMTRNLYVGAEVDSVIAALATPDPSDDITALLTAIDTLQVTDYPARAAAIAKEVARARPHFVGLQEVSEIHINLTPLGLPVVIDLDFLPILENELAARGLTYSAAASVRNLEAAPMPGVSLVDFDVLLVDTSRVTVDAAWGKTFEYNLGAVAPGVELIRGWVGIEATIDGKPYTVVSAHLEAGQYSPDLTMLRAAQITEIVTAVNNAERVIVMGDLNDYPDTPMYQVLAGAGFTDLWGLLRPRSDGFTCCHSKNLSNRFPQFDERIDYIWTRGIGHPIAGVRGLIFRTGIRPRDRVDGPVHKIWPSDHAGLVASLRTRQFGIKK